MEWVKEERVNMKAKVMAEPNMLHIWKHGEKSKRKLGELKANVGQLQE